MAKAIYQFLIMVILFFAAWFGLSRIDYVKIFHLDTVSTKVEKKIGKMVMKTIRKTNKTIEKESVQAILDKIRDRIEEGNELYSGDEIHVHLVVSDDVNAFALPGNHLIVYTGLLRRCDSASELCGVMGHEIGHLRLNHVMKRLAGELGIAVVTSVATNGNTQAATQIVKMLSSSAFQRQQESDADAYSVDCMMRAHINPRGFANFMQKVAKMQEDMPKAMEWISSHPDSKERADAIRDLYSDSDVTYEPVLTQEEWDQLKKAARDY